MSRSFDWDTDTCRPVSDRSQILTSDVNWDEVRAVSSFEVSPECVVLAHV